MRRSLPLLLRVSKQAQQKNCVSSWALLSKQQHRYFATGQGGRTEEQASSSHHYSNVGEMSGSCTDRNSEGPLAGYGSNSMEGSNSGWKTESQLHKKLQQEDGMNERVREEQSETK